MSRPAVPLADRFWPKVDRSGGVDACWLWTDHCGRDGYGRVWSRERAGSVLAHRVAYELLVGPIPEGLDLDHLCRVRACVNPRHLEPVTCRENLLRGATIAAANAAKTECAAGHALTASNVRIWISHGKPYRACVTCARSRGRRHAAARRERLRSAA